MITQCVRRWSILLIERIWEAIVTLCESRLLYHTIFIRHIAVTYQVPGSTGPGSIWLPRYKSCNLPTARSKSSKDRAQTNTGYEMAKGQAQKYCRKSSVRTCCQTKCGFRNCTRHEKRWLLPHCVVLRYSQFGAEVDILGGVSFGHSSRISNTKKGTCSCFGCAAATAIDC